MIEYGPGLYGIGPAAHHYFGKPAKDLNPVEAAFFSSILPNPKERYRQYCQGTLTKWTEGKIERKLAMMLEREQLTQEEYDKAIGRRSCSSRTARETEEECLKRVKKAIKNARPTQPAGGSGQGRRQGQEGQGQAARPRQAARSRQAGDRAKPEAATGRRSQRARRHATGVAGRQVCYESADASPPARPVPARSPRRPRPSRRRRHEIIYTRPSGFWTSNQPAPPGYQYKWRLMRDRRRGRPAHRPALAARDQACERLPRSPRHAAGSAHREPLITSAAAASGRCARTARD